MVACIGAHPSLGSQCSLFSRWLSISMSMAMLTNTKHRKCDFSFLKQSETCELCSIRNASSGCFCFLMFYIFRVIRLAVALLSASYRNSNINNNNRKGIASNLFHLVTSNINNKHPSRGFDSSWDHPALLDTVSSRS